MTLAHGPGTLVILASMRVALAALLLAFAAAAQPVAQTPIGARAYVTLLYSDDFVLSVRVLGESLRSVASAHPYVCLCVRGHVSPLTVETLERDGWRTHWVEPLVPPASVQHPRFRFIYTKLEVWNLGVELALERVVYLDSDVLVVRNVDHLFECGPRFCATMRANDHFNAGVMVLATDADFYAHLRTLVRLEGTRPAGEQDMLNELLGPALRNGSFFAPLRTNATAPTGSAGMQRLSHHYNAQPDIYEAETRWQNVHSAEVRRAPGIIHFHVADLKPWDWLPYVFFPAFWQWEEARARLDARWSTGVHARNAAALFLGALALVLVVQLSKRIPPLPVLAPASARRIMGAPLSVALRLVALRAAYALTWALTSPHVGLAQFCMLYASVTTLLCALQAAALCVAPGRSSWRRPLGEALVMLVFALALSAHRFDLALKALAAVGLLGVGACAAALDGSAKAGLY